MARDAALARSPLFAGFRTSELDALAAHARPREFAAGEQLCAPGTRATRSG